MWFVLNQLNTYFGTSMMIMILCVFVHYLFTIGALARQAWLLRLTHHFRVYNQRHSPGGGGELRHAGDVCECSDALSVRDPSRINVLSSADSDFLIRDYLLVSWFPSKFCRKSQRLIDIVAV